MKVRPPMPPPRLDRRRKEYVFKKPAPIGFKVELDKAIAELKEELGK